MIRALRELLHTISVDNSITPNEVGEVIDLALELGTWTETEQGLIDDWFRKDQSKADKFQDQRIKAWFSGGILQRRL